MTSGTAIGTESNPLRVAVVGSGPSGFYAAVALLKQENVSVRVHVFDRLPTPYGLVRGGVAPDHQKVKSVTRVYESGIRHPGFSFFGHVELGRDIQVEDLQGHYHQIVYAIGNENDRRMGIPGEGLAGCTPATVFVGWYNAHPDYRDAAFDFSSKRIAVVGNGNVAVDVARILAKTADELAGTDIADYALEALRESAVEEIVVLGRRGPTHASFTAAELRELANLPNCGFLVDPRELELDEFSRAQLENEGPNSPIRKRYEILTEAARGDRPPKTRNVRFRFRVSPVEISGDEHGRVRRVRLEFNRLFPDDHGVCRAWGTGRFEELDADWLFVSIGYQGRRLPQVPFDARRGIVSNRDGRVVDPDSGRVVPGQYVVGWAKSGPRGLIGMHKKASADVVGLMLDDLVAGNVPQDAGIGARSIVDLLKQRGVDYVDFEDWKRLDDAEVRRGETRGAPRVKYSEIPEMLDVIKKTGKEGGG